MADVCVDDLAEQTRRLRTFGDASRDLLDDGLGRTVKVAETILSMAILAREERRALQKCLSGAGPELSAAAKNAKAAGEFGELLSTVSGTLRAGWDTIAWVRRLSGANPVLGIGLFLLVVQPHRQAATCYEDLHAFAMPYLNEGTAGEAVPWERFARRVR